MKITEEEVELNDLMGIMQDTFPYYESDDKDDFIYLVRKQDIAKAADRIIRYYEMEKNWI